MKRHGLWQFHRAINKSHIGPFRWWDDQSEDAYIAASNVFYWSKHVSGDQTYTPMTVIVRCAYRYMRRFDLPMTAGEYISVCELIGKRFAAYQQSIDGATRFVDDVRRKTKIVFDSELQRPTSNFHSIRYLQSEIATRKTERRIREEKHAKEIDKICCVCKTKPTHQGSTGLDWTIRKMGLDDVLQERKYGYGYRLCWSCWMHLSKSVKQYKQSEELRLINNRAKRKLHESAKINA